MGILAKIANIHTRKDEVVEMAKAETSPKPKVRKKESLKGRSKVRKAKRAREDIGQECPEIGKVKKLRQKGSLNALEEAPKEATGEDEEFDEVCIECEDEEMTCGDAPYWEEVENSWSEAYEWYEN